MIGHPTVIRDGFNQFVDKHSDSFKQDLFGFVKCKVYPPKQLMFPILPARINDRLTFTLCKPCAEACSDAECFHTDEERALIGTFATPELEEALKYGYRVAEVYEILHWDKRSNELFRPFVYQWLKIKQEASGYPASADTDEKKAQYVADYEKNQGIKLDPNNIKRDEIKREMAKRQLNSFYGKFAQRGNMEQAEIIKTYDRLWQLHNDPKIKVTGSITTSTDTILANWKYKNDDQGKQGVVNVAIASFITAYARRELWRAINTVESESPGCVYYFDTDSIIYKAHRGMTLLPTGSLLGELTSEVAPGEKITQLVCLGPKNYAYKVKHSDGSDHVVVKVKGITLNAKALALLTIDELQRVAERYCLNPELPPIHIPIHQERIACDPAHQIVRQQELSKVYRAVSEKRMIRGNDTLPYGWVSDDETAETDDDSAQHDFSGLDSLINYLTTE